MLTGKTILIVEDDKDQARVLAIFLRKLGANVLAANSLKEAAGQVMYFTFDLIILDLNLGDGTGYDLVRLLREAQIPTPVLAMSGAFDAYQAKQDGYFDYQIEKPIIKNDLRKLVLEITAIPVAN